MATRSDLTQAVDALLGISAAQQVLQLNANTAERAYEAYVLALCCRAVRENGGTVTLTGAQSGPNPATLVFRGGPGSMASTNQDFCYADCTLGNARFEIHVDIEYTGQSGATHEIDVSIYQARHADNVRSSRSSPSTNAHLIGAIECKFYTSRPGVVLARTFVGLLSDCTTNRVKAFVSNRSADGIDKFMTSLQKPDPFNGLTPLDSQSETQFVSVIGHQLVRWSKSQ